jgi:hypothetical protein
MLLPGVSLRGTDKPQRVERLIVAAQDLKYGLAGENRKKPIVTEHDFAECGTKKKFLFSRTLGERIVCALDAAYARNKSAVDAAYARARNGTACKAPAAYGSGDGTDCARGFEEKGGCCFAKLFHAEESEKLLDAIERDPDMSDEQKTAYKNFLEAPPLPEFDIPEKAKGVAVAFIANTQAQLFDSLSQYFSQVIADSPDEWDACKDDHWWDWAVDNAKWAASLAKNGISSVLKFLYKVLEKVGGVWLFKKGKWLIGKSWQAVSTVAQKLAAFIATNPAQAKVMLAGFKYFRDTMATEVAEVLDQAGVFGDVNELYKNASPEQKKWFCEQAENSINGDSMVQHVLQNILSFALGKHRATDVMNFTEATGLWNPMTWLRLLDFGTVTTAVSVTVMSAVAVIPYVGVVLAPLLATLTSQVMGFLKYALQDTVQTILYVNDIKDCFFLFVDIMDITPCLEKWGPIQLKYPNLWMVLLMIRRKRQKMNLSTKTQAAVEDTRATLGWAITDAIGRTKAWLNGTPFVEENPTVVEPLCKSTRSENKKMASKAAKSEEEEKRAAAKAEWEKIANM